MVTPAAMQEFQRFWIYSPELVLLNIIIWALLPANMYIFADIYIFF